MCIHSSADRTSIDVVVVVDVLCARLHVFTCPQRRVCVYMLRVPVCVLSSAPDQLARAKSATCTSRSRVHIRKYVKFLCCIYCSSLWYFVVVQKQRRQQQQDPTSPRQCRKNRIAQPSPARPNVTIFDQHTHTHT